MDVHYPDETPNVMVEITRLAAESDATTTRSERAINERTFEAKLSRLLRRAHRSGIGVDRSWTVECADGPNLMVEVTRLVKPDRAACTH